MATEQDPAAQAASGEFRLGKLFHLTPLVDSIADAEFFFNSVFAPLCMMRGYSSHWHRHGAIYLIAETSIEPMEPLPPPPGEEGTSWFRYMDKYGPHVHNIAFYVENAPALAARLAEAGVRTTDGGTASNTVFAHPKDTPAMLEFYDPGDPAQATLNDPRFSPHWAPLRDDFWPRRHQLGLERLSHITVVVRDLAAARAFYVDVLDSVPLADQPSSVADADASFVLVGEDTVLELVHPRDPSSTAARALDSVGQCVIGVTFKVGDIARASEHLMRQEAPVVNVSEHEILLDRKRTWNTDYRFTDVGLVGDPRAQTERERVTAYDPGYGPLVETRVRVATWNLWGRYGPWEARLPVIIENLRAIDADILALTEVWEDDTRSQAGELAGALGYTEPVYAANLERAGARSGNAVLARWPITRHEVRVLPRRGAFGAVDEEGEERLCVFAEVDGPRGPIQIFSAHLSWSADHSAIRQEQTREIARFLAETRPRPFPAVLCGDLNAEQSSDELRLLTGRAASPVRHVVMRDAWEAACNRDPGFTWSNANPFAAASLDLERRLDHVMVGQPKLGGVGHVLAARVAGDTAIDGMWGSDHLAVVAELRY